MASVLVMRSLSVGRLGRITSQSYCVITCFIPSSLRSVAERDASRRIEAAAGPSWFETARYADVRRDSANARLLTMRI
jgi:hypothetical protein